MLTVDCDRICAPTGVELQDAGVLFPVVRAMADEVQDVEAAADKVVEEVFSGPVGARRDGHDVTQIALQGGGDPGDLLPEFQSVRAGRIGGPDQDLQLLRHGERREKILRPGKPHQGASSVFEQVGAVRFEQLPRQHRQLVRLDAESNAQQFGFVPFQASPDALVQGLHFLRQRVVETPADNVRIGRLIEAVANLEERLRERRGPLVRGGRTGAGLAINPAQIEGPQKIRAAQPQGARLAALTTRANRHRGEVIRVRALQPDLKVHRRQSHISTHPPSLPCE